MNGDSLPALFREGMTLLAVVGSPLLGTLMVVGLIVGIMQSATQVQEPAVGAVPRLAAVGVAIALLGGWMVERLSGFLTLSLQRIADRGF